MSAACCSSCAVGAECEDGCPDHVAGVEEFTGLPRGAAPQYTLDTRVHDLPGELAESLSPAHRVGLMSALDENPDLRIGDVGEDILRGLAAADRGIGDMVSPMLRGMGPLGVIADAHDMRMRALEEVAPDYYGPGAPGGPQQPAPGAGKPAGGFDFGNFGRVAQRARGFAARAAPVRIDPRVVTDQAIIRLKNMTRAAADGDASAQQYLATMRARALAGDVDMRREWKAALALAPRRRKVR